MSYPSTSPPEPGRRSHPLLRAAAITAVVAMIGTGMAGLGSLSAQDATPAASPVAAAPLEVALIDAAGQDAGTATFTESGGMVTVAVAATGLAEGEHGIHVHAAGVCEPALLEPFSSAGPHYNPTNGNHGGIGTPEAHGGDLNNVVADASGAAAVEIVTDAFTLSDGPTSVNDADGSSIIIHERADDLVTDPAGDSGGRVLCGVVAEPQSMMQEPPPPIEGNVLVTQRMPFSEEMLAQLQLPEGFQVEVFAQGLTGPRLMALGPDGSTVYVTQPDAYQVSALRDTDADGVIDDAQVVASNLTYVHGIVFDGDTVYLAGEKEVWTATVAADGAFSGLETIVTDLPDGDQHPRRTIAIGPDDGMLYVNLGSSCNACRETNDENATIIRMNPDGTDREIFAAGLRHTMAFDWDPATGLMWGADMSTDWRGNDAAPEEINQIAEGAHYGWPYCYGDQQPDEYFSQNPPGASKVQFCATTEGPAVTHTSHSSPIDMLFLQGSQFPEEYQGDALVSYRGSWNRDPASGYEVVRVDFEDGQPVGIEPFVSGWLLPDGASHFGRVAGLMLQPDGSLLIAEDTNGIIYRVSYAGA